MPLSQRLTGRLDAKLLRVKSRDMTYEEEWLAISARIAALKAAADLRAQYEASNNQDSYGSIRVIGEECVAIVEELKRFAAGHTFTLPEPAKAAFQRFILRRPTRAVLDPARDEWAIRAGVVSVLVLAGEMTHLLQGRQEWLRSRSAQAFEHLQRTLAANEHVRTQWLAAFRGAGETACEALGAVHLLGHGIFAFKAHAGGGRTDLVFPEPVNVEKAIRSSEGLVLTEWKLAKSEAETPKAFVEARTQADLYKSGVLAGVELRGYRYLIVVTEKQAAAKDVPETETENGVTYVAVNLAIDPRTPHQESKRAALKKAGK